MKIGTMVNFSTPEDVKNGFETLRSFGIDSCQLCTWAPQYWTDENAQKVKELIAAYGMTVSAFWCGWDGPKVWNFYEGQKVLGLVPPEYRAMRVKNLCDGADFAHQLGLVNVITHMGFIPENPYDPEFEPLCDAIRTVAEHLKQNGQWLLFESGQETPVTLLRCFETVGRDNLGVNLDTANLILYGKANPVDALDTIGAYVRDVHAKDGCYPVNGHELGRETNIGEGKVDFRAFFKKLKELNYNGFVTIERELQDNQQAEGILAARDYLAKIIDEVYGG